MDYGETPKPNEVKKGSELVFRADWKSKMWNGSDETYDSHVANEDHFAVADGTKHKSGIDWIKQIQQFTVRDNALAMVASGFGNLGNASNKRIRLESMFSSMTSDLSDLIPGSDAHVGAVRVIGDEMWWGAMGTMGLYVESDGVLKRISNPPVGNIAAGKSEPVWSAAEKSKTGEGLTEEEKYWWNFSRSHGSTIRSQKDPEITSFKVKPGDKVWILTESVWRNLTLEQMKQAKNAEQMVDMARKEPGVSHSLDFSAMLINIEQKPKEKQQIEPEVPQIAPEVVGPKLERLTKDVRTKVGENGQVYELILAKETPGEKIFYIGRPANLGINVYEKLLVSDGFGDGAKWYAVGEGKPVNIGRENCGYGAVYAGGGGFDLKNIAEISRRHVEVEIDNDGEVWVTDRSTNGTWERVLVGPPISR